MATVGAVCRARESLNRSTGIRTNERTSIMRKPTKANQAAALERARADAKRERAKALVLKKVLIDTLEDFANPANVWDHRSEDGVNSVRFRDEALQGIRDRISNALSPGLRKS